MTSQRISSYSLILIGFVFLLQAIVLILGLVSMSGFVHIIRNAAGSYIPSYTGFFVFGYISAALILIIALVTLVIGAGVSGLSVVVQKEQKQKEQK